MTELKKLPTIRIGQTIKIGDTELDPKTIGTDLQVTDHGNLKAVTLTVYASEVIVNPEELPSKAYIGMKYDYPRKPEDN